MKRMMMHHSLLSVLYFRDENHSGKSQRLPLCEDKTVSS